MTTVLGFVKGERVRYVGAATDPHARHGDMGTTIALSGSDWFAKWLVRWDSGRRGLYGADQLERRPDGVNFTGSDTASLAIAGGLAYAMRAAHPGWTHEPVPGAMVPAVVSELVDRDPCSICGGDHDRLDSRDWDGCGLRCGPCPVACPICHRLHDGDDCGGSYLASLRSGSRPCVCGEPDCAERDDDGSLRVGDQIRIVHPRVGRWMTVTSVSEGFVFCGDTINDALGRRTLARYMAEGRVEWRRGEVGS